ncbi:hypothetical protein AB0I94_26965 [Streptomyces sp. NPDC050147]|uniref:hypothetical protein n=1 Tax=Streptomyces sp. NPDC050147 TaxID=3155513 RepID=UPI0034413412
MLHVTSPARLAARYPTSGGTYVTAASGWVASGGFLIGKTASCAAMDLTVATAYAVLRSRYTCRTGQGQVITCAA